MRLFLNKFKTLTPVDDVAKGRWRKASCVNVGKQIVRAARYRSHTELSATSLAALVQALQDDGGARLLALALLSLIGAGDITSL